MSEIRLFEVYWRGPDRNRNACHGYVWSVSADEAMQYAQDRLQKGFYVTHVYHAQVQPLPDDIIFNDVRIRVRKET